MKNKSKLLTISATLAAILAFATVASAQSTILFSDDFSGVSTDGLNGTTPDVTQGTTTWDASDAAFRADGSIIADGGNRGAYLAYTFLEGKIYTLSADIISTDASDWLALGFAENANSAGRFTESSVNGRGWLLTNGNGQQVFGGVRTANQLYNDEAVADTSVSSTYTLTLDTTNASDVKLTVVMGGTTVVNASSLGTFSTLGLGAFGFSHDQGAAGSIDNLELSVIPEPSSYALLAGLLGLSWVMVRRRK